MIATKEGKLIMCSYSDVMHTTGLSDDGRHWHHPSAEVQLSVSSGSIEEKRKARMIMMWTSINNETSFMTDRKMISLFYG